MPVPWRNCKRTESINSDLHIEDRLGKISSKLGRARLEVFLLCCDPSICSITNMTYPYIRAGKIAKLLYLLPGLVLLYLSLDSSSTKSSVVSHDYQSPSRYLMSLFDSYRSVFKSKKRDGTKPSMLLFGMKPHWNVFCQYPEMARFRHLIEFPRDISCPALNQTLTVKFSESPEDLPRSDIVLFTNVYMWLSPEMWAWAHGNRSDAQPWVLVSLDSPLYVPGLGPPEQFRDTSYNWIASYKSDSEVKLPYGYYEPFGNNKPPEVDLRTFIRNKTDLISWMSSNCETLQWDRHRFVNDMKQILSVDKFGRCGEREVPWNDDKAVRSVLGSYKFYLSLENSCCDDYVTEKFWRALDIGIVPVVVGASLEQYERIAPPNSFIHVDQFASLAELAIHLTLVSNSEEKYLEYFQWRNLGRVILSSQEEQYIAPLTERTHCAVFEHYLRANRSNYKTLEYNGRRWTGSCDKCGEKWIKSYML